MRQEGGWGLTTRGTSRRGRFCSQKEALDGNGLWRSSGWAKVVKPSCTANLRQQAVDSTMRFGRYWKLFGGLDGTVSTGCEVHYYGVRSPLIPQYSTEYGIVRAKR